MTTGVIFPGQGSQFVGMLEDFGSDYPLIKDYFVRASEVLDVPLWDITMNGPIEKLASTEITQPALLTASVALFEILQTNAQVLPAVMAGHSLGEYSALVASNSLSFEDAVMLVHRRGLLMKEAVPQGEGGMAAILGLDGNIVEACCDKAEGMVSPANYNAPGQIVIAGKMDALESAILLCKEAGARRATVLNVSGPFHSPLMESARDQFERYLEQVNLIMPTVPVVHNVDGSQAKNLPDLKAKLLAQLSGPVLWELCMNSIYSMGVDELFECGPGKVLTGLNKRINSSIGCRSIGTKDEFSIVSDEQR